MIVFEGRSWTHLGHCRSIIVHCAGLIYAILYEDDRALCLGRADEDDSIVRLIDALDDAALERLLAYATTSGKRFEAKSAVRFWRILLTAR